MNNRNPVVEWKETCATKKLYFLLTFITILVGLAAFVAGRMLNGKIGFAGLGAQNPQQVSISINDVTPAPELPPTRADITGQFVERQDNTIVVQAVTFGSGIGGFSGNSPMDENSGVKIEVVVTTETKIYKDVTQIPEPVNGEIHNVQQAADEGKLDDLNSETFVSVWGRRSGDRIIADVLFYSDPRTIKKPGN